MTTDLVTMAPQMVSFRNIEDIERFAKMIAPSVFVPLAFRGKPGDIVAAVMYGLELGISPMSALQNISVIQGKPNVYGDLLLGMCLGHPSTEYIKEADAEEISRTGIAWCEAKRKGHELVRRTFSTDDAATAHLTTKDIWKAYPSRMLQMRARGFCLRDAYADVLKGIIIREEAQDFIDVTPTAVIPEGVLATESVASLPASLPLAANEIKSLSELATAAGINFGDDMRLLLELDPGAKITGKFLRETLTREQYQDRWDRYTELLREQVEEDVPIAEPPESPQDDAQPSGESTDSGEERSSPTEAASPNGGGENIHVATENEWWKLQRRGQTVGIGESTWATLRKGSFSAALDTVEAMEDEKAGPQRELV